MTMQTQGAVRFYDAHPAPADFYAEVIAGLHASPKQIPPKFFYDETGSRLFDAICACPEYYPTRTEMALLERHAAAIRALIGKDCLLIEPGSGSSQKVRLLLDVLQPAAYQPMDISRRYLIAAAQSLADDYPWLDVYAVCTDFTSELPLPFSPPHRDKIAFFPGSSIGNFEPADAIVFLQRIAATVGPGGGLLIGVDLKKDPAILNAAYNDAGGITAAFNLNLLTRINQELDAGFEIDTFRHQAFYNDELGRIEMHLHSKPAQTVMVAQTPFDFEAGESIHTESSYKYTIDEFAGLAEAAGLQLREAWTDDQNLFSLQFYNVIP
jgi:dimethylhistidine N-methyltransferase